MELKIKPSAETIFDFYKNLKKSFEENKDYIAKSKMHTLESIFGKEVLDKNTAEKPDLTGKDYGQFFTNHQKNIEPESVKEPEFEVGDWVITNRFEGYDLVYFTNVMIGLQGKKGRIEAVDRQNRYRVHDFNWPASTLVKCEPEPVMVPLDEVIAVINKTIVTDDEQYYLRRQLSSYFESQREHLAKQNKICR